MKPTAALTLIAVFAVAPTAASQQISDRVAKAMPKRYYEPECDIDAGHFLVSSGATYLAVASGGNKIVKGTTDPEKARSSIASGIKVVTEAIQERGQAENPGAWYFLGRLYLQGGDIAGADSAFTKAERMAPQCSADIQKWRSRAWAPLASAASAFISKGQNDSAMVLSRRANTISDAMPTGYYNMGIIFANSGQTDSAIVYFGQARDIAGNDLAKFTQVRNTSTFNLAAMYQKKGDHAKAVEALEQYLNWVPNDQDAKRALASSLRQVNKPKEAAAIEKELLASAVATGNLSLNDQMAVGVNAFNEKKYQEAAEAFQKVLERAPWNHDARYNLANTYLAAQDGAKLVPLARTMVEIEPFSNANRRFLAQGFKMVGQQDSLLAEVYELLALPVNVTITGFTVNADGATVVGKAVGRKAEKEGAEIPPAPASVVFEFTDKDGNVVATSTVVIPALPPDQSFDINATASGAGILGWRYHIGKT